ncbi:AMP-binding protein [Glutamicibacter sp. JL.03c]|uniref:AMP-binding protein n=1 Tax=Glutamicibacter sp. JL.03c TaxID=2984842 RepID=UPI0021F724A2|nr:AMP-binding protein [Glutamicibacter sp. JL.03c]UYQ77447.1 AMP-binding protein [Glutamicibacter sp. JL.03c]
MKAYAKGESEPELLDETIGVNFERTAARWGTAEALVEVSTQRRWSWQQLDEQVNQLAKGMIAAGLQPGDRVGIWAPNCAEWVFTQYATAKIGVILVNVNPAYRTHEYAYAVNHSGLRMLVAASEFKTSNYRQMVEQARAQTPELERVVYLDTGDWQQLLDEGSAIGDAELAARLAATKPEDPINIQYTSGTTGYPKGAMLSHRNILNNGYQVTGMIDLDEHDRLCIPVPFYHCFGMVMGNLGCTSRGATMVIPAPGFDAETTLRVVAEEQCTGLYGVPTMFIAMQNHPNFADFDLSSLRTGIMAGSICPVEVMRRCVEDMGMSAVSIAYGMTETSPVSCQTRGDDDFERRTATIGRVHPHVEIKVVDPLTGDTLERGETGEYCTRGYSVMLGYWSDEEKTRAAIDDEGWMHTGDLAVMREDGYCTIVGRIKDMIIRGGENIYPAEIEEFLYQHPDIEDVQVIGVPDEKYGEAVCACLRMKAGREALSNEAVREYCSGQLAHFKIPAYVQILEDFPTTVTGKIRKNQLREDAARQFG